MYGAFEESFNRICNMRNYRLNEILNRKLLFNLIFIKLIALLNNHDFNLSLELKTQAEVKSSMYPIRNRFTFDVKLTWFALKKSISNTIQQKKKNKNIHTKKNLQTIIKQNL